MDNELLYTRDKVIKVSIDLFATKGFRGTSIRDIAGVIGMSISNIYHYFGSKEGLLLVILENSSALLLDKLQEVLEKEIDPLEKFKLLLKTHIRLSQDFSNEAKLFFLNEEHLGPEGMKINRKIQRRVLNIYLEVLNALKEQGLIDCRNLAVLAFNILGLINWQISWYRPEGPLSFEETVEEITSFALHGMLRGGSSGR